MKKCEPHSALFAEVFAALFFIFLLLPTVAVGQGVLPSCSRTVPTKGWNGCQGSKTYSNGERYVGEYRNGQPDGQGTYRLANGDKYVGEFKGGAPHGRGTLTSANGDKYVGEFKDGAPHGRVTLTSANGGKYVGEFKDGYIDGKGTYTYSSGDKYVGQFEDGKRNGQGTLTYANGDKYVGEFKDNKRNGQGTLTQTDGSKYVGEFRDGKFNGQVSFPDGDGYVGKIENGNPNGQGTYTFTNGNKYVGEFKDGRFDGQGTFTFANGEKYVGEFKDGKYDGQGTIFRADGSIKWWGIWAGGDWLGWHADQETITMEKRGGVYVVPVRFNDVITLDAIVDSGASDLSIPADIVSTLVRTKTVTDEDFLGKQTYVLADGSEVPSHQFRIRSLKVGNKTVENVVASIASVNATILLGQSFLSKFKSWSVDNEKHTLVLR